MLVAAACGGDDGGDDGDDAGRPITLVVYDSWTDARSTTSLAAFTDETGIDVEVLRAGDTGTMVSKAVLTAGNPEGDVMFGVDNTFLSRVVDDDVFEPYEAEGLDAVPDELRALVPDGEATPSTSATCASTTTWPGSTSRASTRPPTSRRSPTRRTPTCSSSRTRRRRRPAWRSCWRRSPSSARTAGSTTGRGCATTASRSSTAGSRRLLRALLRGRRRPEPLVVSYGTSPPAEVVFADPPIDAPTTAVVDTTCFRQVEFAGVLRGTDAADEARQLVDFLLSETFQAELPLNLFVYPANADVALPDVFTDNATVPADPATLDPATIAANREAWIDSGPTPSCADRSSRAAVAT